jgi:hypothetical protein
MTLGLETDIYVNPYFTNWFYLRNLTWLQVKLLKEMRWDESHIDTDTDLWFIPITRVRKTTAEITTDIFIERLNKRIPEL